MKALKEMCVVVPLMFVIHLLHVGLAILIKWPFVKTLRKIDLFLYSLVGKNIIRDKI